MKVIFLKQVSRVAKKYEVKEVSNGYAMNYLFPQKCAEMATEDSLARLDELRKLHDGEMKVQEELLAKNIGSLKEITLNMDVKANEQGHLFASIHKDEIAVKLAEEGHHAVPASSIILEKPIKEVGEYDIEVKAGDKTGSFKLFVNAK